MTYSILRPRLVVWIYVGQTIPHRLHSMLLKSMHGPDHEVRLDFQEPLTCLGSRHGVGLHTDDPGMESNPQLGALLWCPYTGLRLWGVGSTMYRLFGMTWTGEGLPWSDSAQWVPWSLKPLWIQRKKQKFHDNNGGGGEEGSARVEYWKTKDRQSCWNFPFTTLKENSSGGATFLPYEILVIHFLCCFATKKMTNSAKKRRKWKFMKSLYRSKPRSNCRGESLSRNILQYS